jgi:hypothetical protein
MAYHGLLASQVDCTCRERSAAPPAVAPAHPGSAAALIALQRTAGNRAVGRMLMRQFTRKDFKRPNFASAVYTSATRMHNVRLRASLDPKNPELSKRNLAVPHRFPWKALRDNTLNFLNGVETEADFKRWTSRMLEEGSDDVDRSILKRVTRLTAKRKKHLQQKGSSVWDDEVLDIDQQIKDLRDVKDRLEDSADLALVARAKLIATFTDYTNANATRADVVSAGSTFLQAMNNFYANVPDLGPHRGVNNPVRERMHLNISETGELSPFSARMLEMTPGRVEGVATTENQEVVTTTGTLVDFSMLDEDVQVQISGLGEYPVNYKQVPFDFGTQ